MENKKQDLITRRLFFKKNVASVLPIMAMTVLSSFPMILKASETGCIFGCSGGCGKGCQNTCFNGCYEGCKSGCKGTCTDGCFGSCINNEAFLRG